MNRVLALEDRVRRDEANAVEAQILAREELKQHRVDIGPIDWRTGMTSFQQDRRTHSESRKNTLQAIVSQPYHAMVDLA